MDASIDNLAPMGIIEIKLPMKKGRRKQVRLQIKYGMIRIIPSQFNPSEFPMERSFVEVRQIGQKRRADQPPCHWILWTNREINTIEQAMEIVNIYTSIWEIEVLFKLLKTDGFDIENCQLGSGLAIRKLILMIMETAIKVKKLKAARKGQTNLQATDLFCEKEIECLIILNDRVSGNTEKQQNPYDPKHLAWASWIIARLAGWKGFYTKSPPGNKTFIDGLQKFDSIILGYQLN